MNAGLRLPKPAGTCRVLIGGKTEGVRRTTLRLLSWRHTTKCRPHTHPSRRGAVRDIHDPLPDEQTRCVHSILYRPCNARTPHLEAGPLSSVKYL